MGGADSSIYAYSDVARDILQNSDYFTSVGKAVNEYVWNSVDYCKPDARVEVRVVKGHGKIKVRKHRTIKYSGIVVEETKNGGGMSRVDLQRFFKMHGETLARKEGRRVRGRFGTGKAAAFGIGRTLIVDTTKDGRRNVVKLDVEALKPGLTQVPIESLLIDQDTDQADRTTVVIDRLKLRRVKMESAKKFLRRSLGVQLRNHDILVEGEKLTYSQPEHERERRFDCPPELKVVLGDCALSLKVAKTELEDEEQGVVILSNSYPMEFYPLDKAGAWASRIFGEVDVPLLDSPDALPPFDNTRSRLNRDNERVASLLKWIDRCVQGIVDELEKETRAKLDKEAMKKLEQTAQELEDVLNEDFSAMMVDLESSPTVGGVGPVESGVLDKSQGVATFVTDEHGETAVLTDKDGDVVTLHPHGDGGRGTNPNPDEPDRGRVSDGGKPSREIAASGEKKKPRGGFKIEYVNEGPDAFRAKFVRETMTIKVNMDYPELAIFKNKEDPRFKALSGEIAFSEYAVATVNFKVEYGHVDVANTAYDALIEYRRSINRLGRKLAPLLTRWFSEAEVSA